MSGYSYSEIQKMQQKAMERVKEMKRNSDIIAQSAQQDLEFAPEKLTNYNSQKTATKVTNMPPNFPKDNPYPSFKEFFREEENHQLKKIESKEEKPQKQGLENLFNEPDKALILGLIMLLKSEGADESLILALTYILS